ncbi:lipopolysaccharide biosynthesis protein [Parapedobacter defluvii]|uniref:Lipopolysaccharide biosynthesis protein n=1 Tax=Parapedobacter defluvii TaxID=2045106 RepID=A0ABQ1LW19_9SPHI|nr:lipopolysaccharide biosynthesis protein [Parapedobacter defluvii]GGC30084.1 lipopolysaccharide biosynthesis protein [Parapedobacter defluvii]
MLLQKAIYTKWFDTLHLADNIKHHSVRGGVKTIVAQLLSFAMTMLSTMVISRLVSPDSFGLVAMVTVFTGFVVIFKDLGFSAAVVQKERISQKQVSTLFWINIFISLAISLLISGISPLLVIFYKEPRLLHITWAFAFSLFITGFGLQHNALMKRQMKFGRLSTVQIISTGISITVGITMAWFGFDYWAIVSITVSFSISNTLLLWILCDWRPNFVMNLSKINEFMRFGMGITGFDLVNYFSRNADKAIIGRFIGATVLGLYDRSYQLLMLPITQLRVPLNSVAMPALSSLQKDSEKYRLFYQRYIFILAFFSMPLVVYLAVFAKEVILIILGPQWVEAAPIFQLLAIAAFIQPVAGTTGVVMITMGQTKRYFIWGTLSAVCTVLGYIIGARWGLNGVILSYIFINYVLLAPCLIYCFRYSPITMSLFFKEIIHVVLFSLFSGIVCFSVKYFFVSDSQPIAVIVIGVIVGAACYLAPWFITNYTKVKFYQIVNVRNFLKG